MLQRPLSGDGKGAEKNPQSEITGGKGGDTGRGVLNLPLTLRLPRHARIKQHHG